MAASAVDGRVLMALVQWLPVSTSSVELLWPGAPLLVSDRDGLTAEFFSVSIGTSPRLLAHTVGHGEWHAWTGIRWQLLSLPPVPGAK